MFAVAAVLIVASAAFVIAADDSDAAGSYDARVFFGDGTQSGTRELSGSGSDVKTIVTGALKGSGHPVEVYPNGTIKSVDGKEADGTGSWVVFQWRPPTGWSITYLNSNGDKFLENGTSYYVMFSQSKTGNDGKTTYQTPSMEPVSTGYFFIKFKEDYNANSYATSVLTEEQRRTGFWIDGSGSTMAAAFQNACDKYGFELNMSDGKKGDVIDLDYVGWLYSFFGLSDEHKSGDVENGTWKYWSQFYWDSKTNGWVYGQTMGHYDPAVYPYIALVRQITTKENVSTDLGQRPSDAPISKISNGCTVTFVDGDGKTTSQKVKYFGSAKEPSTPTKSPTSDTSYVFKGWKGNYTQVISDVRIVAEFTEVKNTKVSGISITDSKSSMPAGTSFTFKATVRPSDATNKDVTWSTSDQSVASVDRNGLVTAKKEGKATITATSKDGGFTDSVELTVTATVDKVWSVSIKEGDIAVEIGKTRALTAVIQPEKAKDRTVKWSSADEGIVKIDQAGKVTAVALGTTTVTVTTNDGGLTATSKVTVVKSSDSVWSVRIDGGDREATVGSKIQLKAVVEPDTAKNKKVEWSVTDTSMASIDASGNLQIKKIGTSGTVVVVVKTVDGGIRDSISIKVRPGAGQAGEVSITGGDSAIRVGDSDQLKLVLENNVTKRSASWVSSDSSVVSVDPKTGEVTARKVGTATIIATMVDGGAEASCRVSVYSDSDVSHISESEVTSKGDTAESGLDFKATEALVKNDSGYTVRTDKLGSVSLPAEVVSSLHSDGIRLTLSISILDNSDLKSAQKKVVGDSRVFEYTIAGNDVPDLGGKAKVTIPYELKDGEKAADVRVYCMLDQDGNTEEFKCSYDAATGMATFETTHFSLYFATTQKIGGSEGTGSGEGSGGSMTPMIIGAVAAVLVIGAVVAVRMRGKE